MTVTVHRPLKGRLQLRMPFRLENRQWLRANLGSRVHLVWVKDAAPHWELSRNHLVPLLWALTREFEAVIVRLEFSHTQKCDQRCRDATGTDCVCSCMGAYHGGAGGRVWYEVGQTTLISPEVTRIDGIVTAGTLRRMHL